MDKAMPNMSNKCKICHRLRIFEEWNSEDRVVSIISLRLWFRIPPPGIKMIFLPYFEIRSFMMNLPSRALGLPPEVKIRLKPQEIISSAA